jgi:ribonuclease BN (tRNA processing enzyme)
MKIIALGSGGWIPTSAKETSCFLIDTGESLIILDTGTGISRLGGYVELLNKYEEIHIIYSHYHLDHIIGLCYIGNWAKEKVINIYGPGNSLINRACKDIMTTFLSPPFFISTESICKRVNFFDYDLNGFLIGNIKISITEQIHTGKSYGITVGNYVHYATDTALNEATFQTAKNVKLLLHDCWSMVNVNSMDHTSLQDIVDLQSKFQVERVGLIHTNPNWKDADLLNIRNSISNNGSIVFVEDEMVFLF